MSGDLKGHRRRDEEKKKLDILYSYFSNENAIVYMVFKILEKNNKIYLEGW